MTASSDGNAASGGDFDLSGFKSRSRKKATEGGDTSSSPSSSSPSSSPSSPPSSPRSPREYGENLPPPAGPKRAGKLPPGFQSKERAARPDAPRVHRKPYEVGDEPRKKFASDFRPREGERPARPARP